MNLGTNFFSTAKKQKLDPALIIGDADMRVTRRQAAMNKVLVASAPSPFDKLPNEILEHIFTFLDHKTLLNSLLVDKRFCNTIENSPNVMKNLPLTVKWWKHLEEFKLQRRYTSVKILGIQNRIPSHVIKFLKTISQDIKTIELTYWNEANFHSILKLLPDVETLTVHSIIQSKHPQPLVNVKTLKIDHFWFKSSVDFNNFFSVFSNVKHLYVQKLISWYFISKEDFQNVGKNLKECVSLTVTGTGTCFLTEHTIANFNKMYEIIRCGTLKNLQTMTLNKFEALEITDWKSVWENHPKLKTIEVEISSNERFFGFKDLVTNARSGTELKFRGTFRLTEGRLHHFKENSLQGIRLKIPKESLAMNEEVFKEIMGEQKQMIEFIE